MTTTKTCKHCNKTVKDGQYCVKGEDISCISCILTSVDTNDKLALQALALQLEQDVIVDHEKRSLPAMSKDPLANEVKSAARRLSTLMLGAANSLMVDSYMSASQKEKASTNGPGPRLATLNELDRIVEIVRKLDLLADKIVARGE